MLCLEVCPVETEPTEDEAEWFDRTEFDERSEDSEGFSIREA
jgi:hypothetical protein